MTHEATDSGQDGTIGSGSRIGIVSFADTAAADTQLITDTADLKAAVDNLTAGGFCQPRGADGIDVSVLNDWATDPDASHVAVTPDDAQLEDLFADLAANISKPGATNLVVNEKLNPDFAIVSVNQPDKGTAVQSDDTTLQWSIPQLGVSGNEGASLEFFIRHVGQDGGTKAVNASITYSDTEGNMVSFPSPEVEVDCGISVLPEKCPVPVEVDAEGCRDSLEVDAGDAYLESLGRILQLNVTVRHVCPEKRVALAVILTELDPEGNEYQRGMKAVALPAHHYAGCRDIVVRCIKFVLPETLNVSGSDPNSMCGQRKFKVRLIAHNIDTDFRCCDCVICL